MNAKAFAPASFDFLSCSGLQFHSFTILSTMTTVKVPDNYGYVILGCVVAPFMAK